MKAIDARLTRSATAAVGPLIGIGLVMAATAFATAPRAQEFDHSALIASGGSAVKVSGPFVCPVGDTARLRATVSQSATGAVAEGSWSNSCTGRTQHWHTTAVVNDGAVFNAGCARGAALAIVRHRGRPVDAAQWLNTLSLTTGRGASSRC